jgi:lysophospholipase L1-like esterase
LPLLAAVLCGQNAPPLIVQQYSRAIELMEISSAAVPGLIRGSEPVLENARQILVSMRPRNHLLQNSSMQYSFLMNLRAYLTMFDSFPKTAALSEDARKQITELRDLAVTLEAAFNAALQRKEAELRYTDRDALARYQDANAKVAPPVAGKMRVVFLGDSITDGWRLNEYFPDSDFVNRGIGGQITGQMLGRMAADVVDLKPAAVVFLGGTNDLYRNVAQTTIQNNIRMIGDLADKNGIKVVLCSILPVHDYAKEADPRWEQTATHPRERIVELNMWMQTFAKSRGYVYVDYFSNMTDSAGMLRKELSDDGLHPNAGGYRIMSPLVWDAIQKAVPPVPAARRRR